MGAGGAERFRSLCGAFTLCALLKCGVVDSFIRARYCTTLRASLQINLRTGRLVSRREVNETTPCASTVCMVWVHYRGLGVFQSFPSPLKVISMSVLKSKQQTKTLTQCACSSIWGDDITSVCSQIVANIVISSLEPHIGTVWKSHQNVYINFFFHVYQERIRFNPV